MPNFKNNRGFNMKGKGNFDFGNKGIYDIKTETKDQSVVEADKSTEKKSIFKKHAKSPMKNGKKTKMTKGTTVFGHEVSKIKNKAVNKAKELGRKVELVFDSGIYSNKYKAENPGRFKSDKINQPRFKAEKKKLLKK